VAQHSSHAAPPAAAATQDPSHAGGDPSPAGRDPSRAGGDPSQARADRYEPLPGLASLPAWIWRRLPRPAKVAVALLPFVAIALALILGPGVDRSKDERVRAQERSFERSQAARLERERREARPRFGAGAAAGESLAARAALLQDASTAVRTDARERVRAGALDGPIRRVECEPFPRTVESSGAHVDASRRVGRYSCLAATSMIAANELHEAGAIGYPYRVRIDFETGRYALCKIVGRPGEGAYATQPITPVPRACGGG
jgi:hypothetical protein